MDGKRILGTPNILIQKLIVNCTTRRRFVVS
jgi:hypothetical protein